MINAVDPSVGIDRNTGGTITGWAHVVQSIGDFFTTHFGTRVMREWYGSNVPYILGRNINQREITTYFVELLAPINQWEPRFRVTQITPLKVTRDGKFIFYLDGEYRPRATYGDFTPEGARRLTVTTAQDGFSVLERLS